MERMNSIMFRIIERAGSLFFQGLTLPLTEGCEKAFPIFPALFLKLLCIIPISVYVLSPTLLECKLEGKGFVLVSSVLYGAFHIFVEWKV